jgi:uncharacterized iron-regulated protein
MHPLETVMKSSLFVVFLLFASLANAQDLPAYRILDKAGNPVDFADVVAASKSADLIFFGELHNNPISHWLQLELGKALAADSLTKLVIGAEMFETDQQILLDEYFAGLISRTSFEAEARLWTNYKTDYKPLLEFAKAKDIPYIATNIPRRYASMVYSKGLESLNSVSADGKRFIAPLPIEVDLTLPGYAEISRAAGGHGGENLPKSQAVKDATMAHFTLKNLEPGSRFLHLNGAYHTDGYEGIVWYVRKARPTLRILTITTQEGDAAVLGKADFTILVPSDMTKTY